MPTLHIANKNYSSWSLRPWVLMRVLGIEFAEVLHPFSPGSNYEAFRAFSPTGKVPCFVDADVVVWESLAIVEYLAESHPQVWPAGKVARSFARAVSAEMHGGFSALRNICTMNCGLRVTLKQVTPDLRRDIDRIDAIWSEGISRFGGPFLAGDTFTAADAFFAPVAFRAQTYGLELSPPAVAYAERLRALPNMVEWYEAGLAETWREPGHEAEAQAAGTIIADLRVSA